MTPTGQVSSGDGDFLAPAGELGGMILGGMEGASRCKPPISAMVPNPVAKGVITAGGAIAGAALGRRNGRVLGREGQILLSKQPQLSAQQLGS